jgi:hypothetical protein
MPVSRRAWDIGWVAVATVVVVICVIIMFPRSQVLALAQSDPGSLTALSLSIGIAAIVGTFLGGRKPFPDRSFKGLWRYLWGGAFGVSAGLFGIASTDLSLWFLVLYSFVTAVFLAALRRETVEGARHG